MSDFSEKSNTEFSSSESEEGNDEAELENNNFAAAYAPLYRDAPLTIIDSMLLILSLLLHHNVTMQCLADIITVINLHCALDGLKKNSLYKFQKFFAFGNTPIQKHFYCSTCLRDLRSLDDMCPSCPRKKNSYFVLLPFLEQLQEMYKRKEFYNSLQNRFHRPQHPPGIITDVYDGSLYRTWFDNGFLSNPNNISCTWYADSAPVFKSAKISVTPIYLTINEVPFSDRKKRENTLLAGLWYGPQKPNMNRFFYAMRADLKKLAGGIKIHVPSNDITINVRGILLMGTCDLVARCQCINFIQFNGDYGCSVCLCKGTSVPVFPNGHVHVYPYENELELRTSEESIRYSELVAEHNKPVMGVKGPTALSKLMPDFIRGIAIDRMHGVEGGVVKKMLTLLFSIEHRAQPFSLYGFIDIINNRLNSIKPPKFVHRMPRSIVDLVHWKISELKLWFFAYSLPVLEGIIRQDYFDHYLLLVIAISILNADKITPQMIEISRNYLHKFVREFENLYGLLFCSINVHQLLHLPDIVERLGPLWVYSCFEYENLNGELLRLVHGTCHIDTQIARSQHQFIRMIKFIEALPDGPIRNFCQKRKRQVKIIENVFPHCYSVGIYKHVRDLPEMIQTAIYN